MKLTKLTESFEQEEQFAESLPIKELSKIISEKIDVLVSLKLYYEANKVNPLFLYDNGYVNASGILKHALQGLQICSAKSSIDLQNKKVEVTIAFRLSTDTRKEPIHIELCTASYSGLEEKPAWSVKWAR